MKRPGEFRVVNQSLPRADGVAKVTGRAIYTSDVVLEGMAYAKVLRSPVAHARIVRMDTSAAVRQPGVFAVVKGDDLGGIDPWYGHALKDHPLLAIGKVRFVGEPVAAVVACDESSAHAALESIAVEYEEMPAVLDPDTALAEGAPLVHERVYQEGEFRGLEDQGAARPSNICQEVHVAWGDVEAAFAGASHVLEGEYYFPMTYAYAMEAYVSVADYKTDALTVYSSAQHPFMVRHDLASVFGLPLSRVRVIVPFVGGGYGSKSYTKIEPLAAACSWKSGRPVKLQLSVQEAILTTRGDDARVLIKTAVDNRGLLLARQATIYLNTGAYAENSPLVCKKAANRIIGPYRFPNIKVDAYAVYTNTVPASSFRGFGAAQATFPAESQMDELAKKLCRDPIEFHLANLARSGEVIHPGYRPIDADLPGDVQLVAQSLGMNESLPAGRGHAVACSASDAGAFPVTTVEVRVCGDGSVIVLSGSTELGQGSHSILAQIAAEEMGIPLEKVQLVGSDTAITPFERSTGASRTTTLMGRAVLEACQEAISQMVVMAAEVLQTEPGALAKEQGGVRFRDKHLSWAEVLKAYFGLSDCNVIGRAYLRLAGNLSAFPAFWEIGCIGVEVAVDQDTGQIKVQRLVTGGDVGLAINPALAEGQDLGAATMGMGSGLFEELVYEGQQLLNGTMLDYRVPKFSDLPPHVNLILIQNQDGAGPYGAKGAGEGALNPVGASLANAVYDALGVRIRRLPLTPERVWRSLADRKKSKLN